MSDLADRLGALCLDDRSKMLGYISRVKRSKKYFQCQDDYLVVPDIEGSRLILCQRRIVNSEECFVCLHCTDYTVLTNLRNSKNIKSLKED